MNINYRWILIATVLFLFFLKIYIIYFYQGEIRVWEDHYIAKNMLATGKMFYMQRGTPNYMFQFPVYPSLLYATYKIFGIEEFNAIVLNIIIVSITSFLLYRIFIDYMRIYNLKIGRISDEFVALIAVLSFNLHPFITYYSMFNVHPFIIDTFLPTLIIFLSIRYLKRGTLKELLIFSIGTGIGILNRSTSFVAVFPMFILSLRFLGVKKTIYSITLVAAVSGLIISPWLARGNRIYNNMSMAPMINEVLWKGVVRNSDGSNYLLDGKMYKNALTLEENNSLDGKPIIYQNEFFKKKYNQILFEDPLHVMKMYFIKLKNFWTYHENIGIEYEEKIRSILFIYKGYSVLILILTIFAIIKVKSKAIAILSYPIGLSIVQSMFYVETRHRMIAEPIIIFFPIIALIFIFNYKDIIYSSIKERKHFST